MNAERETRLGSLVEEEERKREDEKKESELSVGAEVAIFVDLDFGCVRLSTGLFLIREKEGLSSRREKKGQ